MTATAVSYEKSFDQLCKDLGRHVLEKSLSTLPIPRGRYLRGGLIKRAKCDTALLNDTRLLTFGRN